MISKKLAVLIAALSLVVLPVASQAVEVPQSWKRTMTNDPVTNYFIAKVTAPLANKDAETVRTVLVSLVAMMACRNVHADPKVSQKFLVANDYYKMRGKRWSDAEFMARDSLRGMDSRDVAHLCAGLDYLFGPNGKLAPNLLQFGPTDLLRLDPKNPYVVLPTLPGDRK